LPAIVPVHAPLSEHLTPAVQRPALKPRKRNLLLRIVDAVGASNRRKAHLEIARWAARNTSQIADRP